MQETKQNKIKKVMVSIRYKAPGEDIPSFSNLVDGWRFFDTVDYSDEEDEEDVDYVHVAYRGPEKSETKFVNKVREKLMAENIYDIQIQPLGNKMGNSYTSIGDNCVVGDGSKAVFIINQ